MQLPDRNAPGTHDQPPARVFLFDGRCGDRSLLERAVREVSPELVVLELAGGPGAAARLCAAAAARPAIACVSAFAGVDSAVATMRELRREPRLVGVPILALGTFESEAEVVRLLGAGATSAIAASPFVDVLLGTIRSALRYWTHVAVLVPVPIGSRESGPPDRRSETRAGVANAVDAR